MKRPGVAEKKVVDPDLEPDFYKISEIHRVPESADEESLFLQKTLESGPKARMPVVTNHFKGRESPKDSDASSTTSNEGQQAHAAVVHAPLAQPHASLYQAHQQAQQQAHEQAQQQAQAHQQAQQQAQAHQQAQQQAQAHHHGTPSAVKMEQPENHIPTLPAFSAQSMVAAAQANSNAALQQLPKVGEVATMPLPFAMPPMDSSDPAASSFAAGFAAATAHYHQQFYAMMSNMAATGQVPEGFPMGATAVTANPSA